MGKFLKIIVLTVMLLLIVFSLLADLPFMAHVANHLTLAVYIRLASIFTLAAAALYAWGHKRRLESSQKFKRAGQIKEQAEAEAKKRQAALDRTEARLKADFAEKEAALDKQIGQSVVAYQERLKRLKAQNLELKETVNKLMKALKAERAKNR